MYKYSICTLVTDFVQYAQMKKSFISAGFINDCEFYFIDNSKNNSLDGYTGINYFVNQSNAKYTIICHQDILINHDHREKLDNVLEELDKIDPKWGIAGNAGGYHDLNELFCNLNDRFTQYREINLPQLVLSLDENFLIINASENICCSNDLYGFHMYGTDLCLQAFLKGNKSYVIDFYISHLGCGAINQAFHDAKQNLINKYSNLFRDIYIKTTCSEIFISNSQIKKYIFNKTLFMQIKKLIDKYKISKIFHQRGKF